MLLMLFVLFKDNLIFTSYFSCVYKQLSHSVPVVNVKSDNNSLIVVIKYLNLKKTAYEML